MPLCWTRSFPNNPDDGTGKDPQNPRASGRVYLSDRVNSDKRWHWTVSAHDRRIGSGYQESKEAAIRIANATYDDWLTRNPGRPHG